jgi:N-acetylglucosaminyldiphosphoundecaprenol N-acetyl-beta-D-mannosaminyltransferase
MGSAINTNALKGGSSGFRNDCTHRACARNDAQVITTMPHPDTNTHAHGFAGSVHPRFGINTIDVEGFQFLDLSERQFAELVVSERKQGRGGWAITPNCDILRQAHADAKLRALFHGADAIVADGMPIIWASRIQGTPLRGGRVCGSDLIYSIPALCAQAGLSIYLLGGVNGSGERTAEILTAKNPGLNIAGMYSPPFGFEKHPEQYDQMRTLIQAAKPDVIFVALSVPKSERLIQEIRASAPDAWWIGVGASFDFVSGSLARAPGLMQRIGLEWLYRMTQDPQRLIARYLRDGLPYAALMFFNAVKRRLVPVPRPAVQSGQAPASTAEKPQLPA